MTAARSHPAHVVLGLWLGVGLGLAADALRRAAHMASFPYDLNFWSEDYFMITVLRLHAGLPLYGDMYDASSSIYSPGGPLLQYALLAPLSLETSVAAHRWLSQLGQLGAVAIGVLTILTITRRYGLAQKSRWLVASVSACTLLLSAYANPVAVGLHPIAWESLIVAATGHLLVDWDRRSLSSKLIAAIALPALGVLAKQSAGPSVALALAAGFALQGVRSWPLSLLPFASGGLTAFALHRLTDGNWTFWAYRLLRAQGFEGGSKVTDVLTGMALWWLPSLVIVIAFSVRALRRRTDGDRAWLRAAILPLAYAPAAIGGFAKELGGPNNIAALCFFLSIVAVAALMVLALERRTLGAVAALVLLLVQIVLLFPRRYVPTARDRQNAERICEFAKTRMACGEKVLLGRGTSCTIAGGAYALGDRMVSIHDVWASGGRRKDALRAWDRIARAEYDLVLVHHTDLHRFGLKMWPFLSTRYKAFYTTPHDEPGEFWHDGWMGYASRRMLFYEKKDQTGTHTVDDKGRECRR